jgi:hypothetical protein
MFPCGTPLIVIRISNSVTLDYICVLRILVQYQLPKL